MYYYDVAILGNNVFNLTYQYNYKLKVGQKILVTLNNKPKQGVVVDIIFNKPSFKCENIRQVMPQMYDYKMIKLALYIAKYYICNLSKALELFIPFNSVCEELNNVKSVDKTKEKQNLIKLVSSEQYNQKQINDTTILSKAQKKAFEFCNNNKQALIYGVTGSGKTQVYIKAIVKELEFNTYNDKISKNTLTIQKQNKQVLFLVPEISLTPSMQARMMDVFGNRVGVYHSKITKKNKQTFLLKLENGDIDLVIGARSAFFLPFSNLSLIIVDEENDSSYKSSSSPCVNIKDLSIYYSKFLDSKLILGSATPSLTSYKTIPCVKLKNKFYEGGNKIIYENETPSISPLIAQKIKKVLENKKQIIIFIPIRGNFKTSFCENCENCIECVNCSVSLTYYEQNNYFKCHQCNYVEEFYDKCHKCGSELKMLNIGTNEIQKKLNYLFDKANIEVLDRNNANTSIKLNTILTKFEKGKIDILIGTQMITKGHNYPNVDLVVAIGLDLALFMPTFYAKENAISLCFQICGRSGRQGVGEVIVQSKNIGFFEKYLELGYENFIKDEMNERENKYPPYRHIVRVLFSGINKYKTKTKMHECIKMFDENKINIIGYGESFSAKVKKMYRYEILLGSKNMKYMFGILHNIKDKGYIVDMDVMD